MWLGHLGSLDSSLRHWKPTGALKQESDIIKCVSLGISLKEQDWKQRDNIAKAGRGARSRSSGRMVEKEKKVFKKCKKKPSW